MFFDSVFDTTIRGGRLSVNCNPSTQIKRQTFKVPPTAKRVHHRDKNQKKTETRQVRQGCRQERPATSPLSLRSEPDCADPYAAAAYGPRRSLAILGILERLTPVRIKHPRRHDLQSQKLSAPQTQRPPGSPTAYAAAVWGGSSFVSMDGHHHRNCLRQSPWVPCQHPTPQPLPPITPSFSPCMSLHHQFVRSHVRLLRNAAPDSFVAQPEFPRRVSAQRVAGVTESQIYFFFLAISELDQDFRPDATFLATGVRPPDNSSMSFISAMERLSSTSHSMTCHMISSNGTQTFWCLRRLSETTCRFRST